MSCDMNYDIVRREALTKKQLALLEHLNGWVHDQCNADKPSQCDDPGDKKAMLGYRLLRRLAGLVT